MKRRILSMLLVCCMLFSLFPTMAMAESNSDIAYAVEGGNIYFSNTGGTHTSVIDCDETVTAAIIPSAINGMTVSSINHDAFAECSALTNVSIPDSITLIGSSAFEECVGLTTITIPNSITRIDSYAFKNCTSLAEIVLPEYMTEIDTGLFQGCTSLRSIVIPNGITSIGGQAFEGCSTLSSITIPDEVTSIGSWAFCGCSSVTTITIPSYVTTIEMDTFRDCSNLREIKLSEDLASIKTWAFYNCTSLENILIPENVNNIDASAFDGCSGLKSFDVSLKNAAYSAKDGVLFDAEQTEIIRYPNGAQFDEYKIPDGVITIGNSAFRGNKYLKNVSIPDSVTSIGPSAFEKCEKLQSIVIPNNIKAIEDSTFEYCNNLSSVVLLDGVTGIGDYAFYGSGLTYVVIPDSITQIGYQAFFACSNMTDVYYAGSEEEWDKISADKNNWGLTVSHITVHYNSTGPDDDSDGEVKSNGSVRYFSEWDAANQIAYFGEDTLHLSSAVTDETDTSFLADVDNLVGSYVLAETRSRDDDLIGPNILLSIKPVETKAGTVTAVDDSSITIDGVSYLLPEGWLFAEAYEGKRVIYHLNEGNLVGIEELETLTGTLKSWNAETGRITIDPDGLDDVTTYTLSPLADEETISVLEQNKGQNADVKYVKDSMSFIYQVRLVENSGGDKAPFELGKDNFRFVNSPNDFLTDSEYEKWKQVHGKEATFVEELRKEGIYSPTQISQEAFDRLTLGLSNSAKQYISEFKDSVWGGSCYGMSTAMAIRYIDANRLPIEYILPNNSANIKTTNELFAPKESDGVEDLINYYQLMYRYPYILSLEKYYESLAKKDYTEAVYNLVNEIKNDDVPVVACILDYSPEPSPEDGTDFSVLSAHAVILLDVVDNDESFYTATVYDPNFSESFGTMLIYKNIQEERKFDSIQIKYVSGGNSSEQSRVYDCLYNYTASIEEMDIRNLYGLAKDNTYLNNYDSPVLVVPIDEDIVFSSESSSLTYQLGTIVEKSNIYGPFSDIGALIVGDSVGNLTFMLDSFDDENYSFDISSHSASSSAGIILEDFYVEFMSTHDMHVELNNNQTLSIKSDQPSMISTMVTINKTSEKWPWYTVAIDVSDATELTLALVKDSIEISSDNFQNAAIAAKNDDKIVFEDIDVDAATVQLVNREDGIAVRPIELSHTTTFVPAVAATCKETGTVAHWHCSVCDKDFADSEGAVELVDVVIPVDPANHVGGTELRNVKAATYTEEGYTGDTYCLGCGAKIADGTVIPKKTQSSGGGSNGASAYVIAIDSAKYGDVTSSHKSATKGTTITLTVNPDKGYTLETLTVIDKNGDKVKLTGKNGKYTFTMPASKVTVKATFMEDNSMLNFFVDVPVDAYYYDAVLWAAENGITGGTSDTTFSPNAPCTRAQIVTFLWRAAGSPVVNYAMNFTDVPADAYYAEAVRWAASLGITTGTGNGMFSPDATCTRAQAMTFIYRSVQAQGGGMQGAWMFQNPFEDVHLENYYGEAVMWAVANGITSSTSDTTFSPNNDCTRAQIVTFLYRSMK